MNTVNIKHIIEIAQQAGHIVLSIYNQASFDIQHKADQSALTSADIESHAFISSALERLYPSIPIISEESTQTYEYVERKNWDYFFLVDPLDGTKEFIQRNGEFTINIALIKKDQPILGVIHAPALGMTYHAEKDKGAYRIINNEQFKLPLNCKIDDQIRVVTSRSHCCSDTKKFIAELQVQGNQILETPAGSALKFGLIAEGNADIYPRFSPTMEWDTAAGHILINEIGKQAILVGNNEPLHYNKLDMKNSGFIVQ